MKLLTNYILEKFKISKDIQDETILHRGDSFIMVYVKNNIVGHTSGTVLKRDYISLEELEENFKNNTRNYVGGGTHYKAFKYSDRDKAEKYERKLSKNIK